MPEEHDLTAAGTEEKQEAPREAAKELREHFPPASAGQDTYTLLKFYNLSSELLKSVLEVGPLYVVTILLRREAKAISAPGQRLPAHLLA